MELNHIAKKYIVSENKTALSKLPPADQCLVERHIIDLLKNDEHQNDMYHRAVPYMQDEIIAGFVNGNLQQILKPENLQKILEEERKKGNLVQGACFSDEHSAQADLPRRSSDISVVPDYGV